MSRNRNLFGLVISVFVSVFFFWLDFFFLPKNWGSDFLSYFKHFFNLMIGLFIVAYFLFKVFFSSSDEHSKSSFSMERVFRFMDVLIAVPIVLLFLFFIGSGPVGIIGVIFFPFLAAPVGVYIVIRIASVLLRKLWK